MLNEAILNTIQTPAYICEEKLLIQNLEILQRVQNESGAKVLLALKGFALTGVLHIVDEYLSGATASGLHEAKLAKEYMNGEVHAYSPAFKDEDIDEVLDISKHIIFNSFNQWNKYKEKAIKKASCGLRINPQSSAAPNDLYNPCAPFSRLGITKAHFKEELLEGIEGLHFHALCEESFESLEKVLKDVEDKFGKYIQKMKWVNFGGGHHITKKGYDVSGLIKCLKNFGEKYNVQVYIEPGEAVGWETGTLVASVLDIVENEMKIAILDTSAEAHMPDTLAMPYKAQVRNCNHEYKYLYRLAGNTCLAGDIMGDYKFENPLKIGDKIIFEDQIHYTIVKNTTFNGIKLPNLLLLDKNNKVKILKSFGYEEYRRRN